jgi:hypothetical protein
MLNAKEQHIVNELAQRNGGVLYFQDIASHFVDEFQLEYSAYTQLLYVNLREDSSDELIAAQSKLFELLVFIKKLERRESLFEMPFVPLKEETQYVGKGGSQNVQKVLADSELLYQLLEYIRKKYIFVSPENEPSGFREPQEKKEEEKPVLVKSDSGNFKPLAIASILLLLIVIVAQLYFINAQNELIERVAQQQEVVKEQVTLQSDALKELSDKQYQSVEENAEKYRGIAQHLDSISTQLAGNTNVLKSVNTRSLSNYRKLTELNVLNDFLKADSVKIYQ